MTVVESSNFDTATIERALLMLALHAGSPTRASEALQAQGIRITKQTLHEWKNTRHAERYAEVCKDASNQLADRIAAEAEQFMLHASRVELKALEKLEADLDADKVKDVASALRNITTAKALNNDKIASPLRGRPTVIRQDKTAEEAIARLERLGVVPTETVTDAEVVEPQDDTRALPASS